MKILVVCGGDSREREVSIVTGNAVYNALLKSFSNVECYICKTSSDCVLEILKRKPDVVFIALHGSWGEDGRLVSALELLGIRHTASDFQSSCIAMNKYLTKLLLKENGICTANATLIRTLDQVDTITSFPVCIKPNREGSSIGVEFASTEEELKKKVTHLLGEFNELIVEEKLVGKELTVGILNDTVFPVIEIQPLKGFYNYENKYTSGNTRYIIPADIPTSIAELTQETAKRAYDTLGCKSCARVDIILHKNIPYVLEVNTVPGMTPTSLIPKAAKAYGMSFEELVRIMVEEA